MKSLKASKHYLLNWFIVFSLTNFLGNVSGEFFTRYRKYHNLTIKAQHKTFLQVKEEYSYSGKYREPAIDCGVACNLNPDCSAFTLNYNNTCLLLNNKTSLIYTTVLINSTLFSKLKLWICIKDHYPDLTLMQCFQKKLEGSSCSSSDECSVLKGLDCKDTNINGQVGTCKCINPDVNYWDSAAGTCKAKQSYGSPCKTVGTCLETQGLECRDSNLDNLLDTCNCLNPDLKYWDNVAKNCLSRKPSGEPCQSNEQCFEFKGLVCTDTNSDAVLDTCLCRNLSMDYWNAAASSCQCINTNLK
jgi:hypothetical protein